MRQARALLCVILVALVVGCADEAIANPRSLFNRFRPLQTPAGPDVIEMQVALIERPLFDPFLGNDLWAEVDEQVLSLQQKLVLDENGFRVGQVGGFSSTGLQKLLLSERSNANPRRIYVHAGNPALLTLGPAMPTCHFELPREGGALPVSLDQAECLLSVVPSLAGENRIKLAFSPQIRYGQAKAVPRPNENRSGFILRSEQPTEVYEALAWEVALAANQYTLIGARVDRPRTLGYQSFLRADEPMPVQRLLAVRVSRTSPGLPVAELAEENEQSTSAKQPLPLVLQAAYSMPK